MVRRRGVLLSLFLLMSPCLSQIVTLPAPFLPNEVALSQEALDLELDAFYASNATVTARPNDFFYLPASQSKDRIRVPRGAYNLLQKRDNYCFDDAPSAFCADSNLCCTDTAENTGWCCWYTLNCGQENHDCITPTVVFTSTSTIISRYSEYVTFYVTSYGTSTVIETITNTNIVTATNVATATEVEVTTITARDAKRARGVLVTDVACPESSPTPVALSTTQGDLGDINQNPITAFVKPSHGLTRRQAITTTVIVNVTVSETITISTTSLIDSTAYVTSTSTEEVTTTSALNAQTTIYVTSTYTTTSSSSRDVTTSSDSTTASSSSPTSSSTSSSGAGGAGLSQDTGTGGEGGGGGLGGGAVAGIAVGAAAGALIVAGIIAFAWYRRRNQKKADALGATPAQRDSHLIPLQSDAGYSDKMAPAAAYDPRSRPISYQHDYEHPMYHEADGRMVGWEQMHEMEHPPAELAAYQRYGMEPNELPHDRH